MTKTRLITAAAALVAASASPASADDKEKARAHFQSAEAHFQSGNYRAAVDGYTDSYRLFKAPILLFNIGLCHDYLKENEQAVAKYREYLAAEPKGAKAPEARQRMEKLVAIIDAKEAAAKQQKRAAIAELKAQIATLRDNPTARAAAIIKLNEIEPSVELLFDLADAYQAAGDKARAIETYDKYITSDGATRADEARTRRDVLSKGKTDGDGGNGQIVEPPPTTPSDDRPSIVTPIVLTGSSILLLAVGVGFGISATGTRDDLDTERIEADPPLDNNDPRFDDGPRSALIANISFAASLASAAVAGYFWYRFVSASKPAPAAIAVSPRSGGVELGVEVRF